MNGGGGVPVYETPYKPRISKSVVLVCERGACRILGSASAHYHVIHNAWPVNFNRHIASFESHVAELFKLCVLSSENYTHDLPPLSLSPGDIPSRDGPHEVPETPLGAMNTAEFGYPAAKCGGARGNCRGAGDAVADIPGMSGGNNSNESPLPALPPDWS
ncbi:hypothetical protein BDZ89DRAFT_1259978 [Hymenopellis radicata]|nr:hypothetical protein BDZ89DRAFT_1259978 [Hymenopellis radicata]